jgi:hypothetical protein
MTPAPAAAAASSSVATARPGSFAGRACLAAEINGTLVPFSDDAVTTDLVTGDLVGTTEYQSHVGKFTVVGAGAGLAVSGSSRKDRRRGTARGAAIGTLVGAAAGPSVSTDDVVVPIATEVGVMLRDGVALPSPAPPARPGGGL